MCMKSYYPHSEEHKFTGLSEPLQYMDEVELAIKSQSDLHHSLAKPPDRRRFPP